MCKVQLKLRLPSVTGVVTSIAVDVEPSPVIDCEVEFKPSQDGMLLKTSSAAIFLLIGVPLGSSTTWNKSTALDRHQGRSIVLLFCLPFLSPINPYWGMLLVPVDTITLLIYLYKGLFSLALVVIKQR